MIYILNSTESIISFPSWIHFLPFASLYTFLPIFLLPKKFDFQVIFAQCEISLLSLMPRPYPVLHSRLIQVQIYSLFSVTIKHKIISTVHREWTDIIYHFHIQVGKRKENSVKGGGAGIALQKSPFIAHSSSTPVVHSSSVSSSLNRVN